MDKNSSAQNLAVCWLTDDDEAKLDLDDDFLLQRYALATFYFSRKTKNGMHVEWNNADNWMSEKGICLWFGVECPPLLEDGFEVIFYDSTNNDMIYCNMMDNDI
jgi:hypothetical protein